MYPETMTSECSNQQLNIINNIFIMAAFKKAAFLLL